jgi:hypothetical protein
LEKYTGKLYVEKNTGSKKKYGKKLRKKSYGKKIKGKGADVVENILNQHCVLLLRKKYEK